MGLKIREGSAWPVFFGFAEHKTFVEYFRVPQICQTPNQNMFRFVNQNPSQCDPEAQEGRSVRGKRGKMQPPTTLFLNAPHESL